MKVSVIIVDYKNEKGLKKCLASIPKKKSVEIIVVDNNKVNRGFAKGCNLGAKQATGEVLFFLNPDCELMDNAVEILVQRLYTSKRVGIVAPQLLNDEGEPYLSFTKQASYACAFVVYSFLGTWFKNNPCSKDYWYEETSLDKSIEVESVSGAALMIKKKDFEVLGGFNENMFMYWEDYELCWQMLQRGKIIAFEPAARVVHSWGGSTTSVKSAAQQWFIDSRKVYFQIRFGRLKAFILEGFLRICESMSLRGSTKNLVRSTNL